MVSEVARYLREEVDLRAKSGFYKLGELVELIRDRVADEVFEDDDDTEVLVEDLARRAKKALAALAAAEAKWDAPTINDRIEAAFEALERDGIVALENAGYTMSDGWGDVNERARDMPKRPRGATFYHGQDLERGVRGDGLMLAYGAYVDQGDNSKESVVIGHEICETLRSYGVKTKWNGDVGSRIEIPKFTWQKRAFTKRPKIAAPKAAANAKTKSLTKPNAKAKAKPKPKPNPKPKEC